MVEEEKKKGKGWKIVGIGCGVIVLILIIGIVIIAMNWQKIAIWGMEKAKPQIVEALPDDYDKAKAEGIFDEFTRKMLDNKLSPAVAQEWGEKLKAMMQDQRVDPDEAEDFINFMDEALKKSP